MISLHQVAKTYCRGREKVTAFYADSLTVERGEYVAVVGPSGSGKTTFLTILGGMLAPDEGQVMFNGAALYGLRVAERTRFRRDHIGFVFQTFNLIPYLTALENVQVPLWLAGTANSKQSARARELLDQVGLSNRINHKPCELSTGQQQRVALARTLANDPSVILADEPTGNLDPESRETVLSLFDDFKREGRTIVMVTHDAAAAARADRRLQLYDGGIERAVSEADCLAA